MARLISTLALLGLVFPAKLLCAQDAATPTYTLNTTARAVITDVVVLDKKGNPVTGLPPTAFRLTDNGHPQRLASFEEHASTPATFPVDSALPRNTYTNDTSHLPPVLNIVVIDTLQLSVVDQMFLAYQMERFVAALPAGMPIAIYLRAGSHTVQVAGFTTDRPALLRIVHNVLPHLERISVVPPREAETLHQIATDLASLPGRKNVLWFTGSLAPPFTPSLLTAERLDAGLRLSYDELEAARVAIYPIDARGLMTDEAAGGFASRVLMRDAAEATGGTATYNSNGVAEQASRVVAQSDSFYTLAYTPAALEFDGKWHQVRVAVDGKGYHVSYRHGYFADDSHKEAHDETRTRLGLAGTTVQEKPSDRLKPIVFTATVAAVPAAPGQQPPAAGQTRYAVQFSMPAVSFDRHIVLGKSRLQLGVGILAMNRYGQPLVRSVRQRVYDVDEDKLRRYPDTPVPATQFIDLNPGDTYLYLVVWDEGSERVGTLTVPVLVPSAR